jgi:hypothetical protein
VADVAHIAIAAGFVYIAASSMPGRQIVGYAINHSVLAGVRARRKPTTSAISPAQFQGSSRPADGQNRRA